MSLKFFIVGFIASLLLTIASFLFVVEKTFSRSTLLTLVIVFAVMQAIVQLFCFLHLGQEKKPRWKLLVFYFMVLILLIIAIGSLWIMQDLNARMM